MEYEKKKDILLDLKNKELFEESLKRNFSSNFDNYMANNYTLNNSDTFENKENIFTDEIYNNTYNRILNMLDLNKISSSEDDKDYTLTKDERITSMEGFMMINGTKISFKINEDLDYNNREYRYSFILNVFASLQIIYSISLFILIRLIKTNSHYVSFNLNKYKI